MRTKYAVLHTRQKRTDALRCIHSQFGIDVMQEPYGRIEKYCAWKIDVCKGHDFVAVINHINAQTLQKKSWYVFEGRWVEIGSLSRTDSIRLYHAIKPQYVNSLLAEYNGLLPFEKEESMARIICDEYLSNRITKKLFGLTFNFSEF